MPHQSEILLLTSVAFVLTTGLWLRAAWRGRRPARRAARARRLGVIGEAKAERLLRDAGFRVVGRQVAGSVPLRVDGVLTPARVRVDFIVKRRGRMYVADAKAGPKASAPTDRGTRRQLLEYLSAYPVDGALLVDAERGRIHELTLPMARNVGLNWLAILATAIAVAIACLR